MPDVFISYSRKDKDFVVRVHDTLAAQGRDVWVDWEDIPLTADWWSEICSGIESADTFVLVITPDSLSSPVCHMEIDHATRYNKRLVPLVRIPVDEKTALAAVSTRALDDNALKALDNRDIMAIARENWNAVARHNWLFFEKDEEFDLNYQRLLKAIDTDLDYVRDHTRLTIRAREWENKTRNESFLLRGDDLLTAEAWLAQAVGKEPSPTSLHAEFIAVSRQAESLRQAQELARQERELNLQRQSARRSRYFAGLMAVGMVAVLFSLGLAISNGNEARNNENIANTNAAIANTNATAANVAQSTAERRADEADSVSLAEEAEIVAGHDPFLAYTLGLYAVSLDNPPPRAQSILAHLAYETGAVLPFVGHDAPIITVADNYDGTQALSLDTNGNFILWDTASGEQLIPPFAIPLPPNSSIYLASISHDLHSALISDANGSLQLVMIDPEAATPTTVIPLQEGSSGIMALALSPNGRYALASFQYGGIYMWDVDPNSPTFGALIKNFDDHPNVVTQIGFSADSTRALSASDHTMIVWNMDDTSRQFTQSVQQFDDVSGGITFAVLNGDGSSALSLTGIGTVTLWNITDGKGQVLPFTDNNTVKTLAFSSDGQIALFGDATGQLTLLNLVTGQADGSFRGHSGIVNTVTFSADGLHALSGGADGRLVLWDLLPPEAYAQFSSSYKTTNLLFNPDGRTVISFDQNLTFAQWDVDEQSPSFRSVLHYANTLNYESISPQAVALSPDGWHALTADCTTYSDLEGCSYRLALWDVPNESLLLHVPTDYYMITALALSPDGHTAVVAGCVSVNFDETVCTSTELAVWDVVGGYRINTVGTQGSNIAQLLYTPDGSRVLSINRDNTATLWDVNTRTTLHVFDEIEATIRCAAFSPDGSKVLFGDQDGSLTLWNTQPDSATFGRRLDSIEAHSQSVTSVAFSPLGTQAISGASDGSLTLWDMTSGEALRAFPSADASILAVAFSPDGRRVLVANDNNLMLWHVDISLGELITWLDENRYVDDDLTCIQREQYDLQPLCDGQNFAPTRTAFPTLLPFTNTPTFTPSATVNVTLTTLTPTATGTNTLMPTVTPVYGGYIDFGEHSGDVPIGGSESWRFNATAGTRLTVIVNPDAVSSDDPNGQEGLAFDSTVAIYAPDGNLLAFNDDHQNSDGNWLLSSVIDDITFPDSGVYQIVVSSYASNSAGHYTLSLIPGGVTPTPTLPITPTAIAPLLPARLNSPTPTPTPAPTLTPTP